MARASPSPGASPSPRASPCPPSSATASRISSLNAVASTSSPAWMSIARRVLPAWLALKRSAGSLSDAPFAQASFMTLLQVSPVQRKPSCDQTGVPIHFTSSTTSWSAARMGLCTQASAFSAPVLERVDLLRDVFRRRLSLARARFRHRLQLRAKLHPRAVIRRSSRGSRPLAGSTR